MTFQYFFFDTYPGDFIQVIPAAVIAGIVCLAARKRKAPEGRILPGDVYAALFVCYMAGLLALTVTPVHLWDSIFYRLFYGSSGGMTMFPFSPSDCYRFIPKAQPVGQAIGNIAMFLPFGILLPLAKPQISYGRTVMWAGLTSLAIELVQPFMSRMCDSTDLLLNVFGAAIGAGIYFLIKKGKRE